MRRPKHLDQVKKRVEESNAGNIFIPSDFFDITEAVKINKCLDRLERAGLLRRIMRGIYMKPRFSELLNKDVPPRMDDIATAIARNYGWTIIPFGDTALNMLGLSTQVPAVWLYISDGPYKSYEFDGMILKFKHTDNKNEIIGISYKAALVVQSLKALGKANISDQDLKGISNLLSEKEKRQMIDETKRVTTWVYERIRKICKEENHG